MSRLFFVKQSLNRKFPMNDKNWKSSLRKFKDPEWKNKRVLDYVSKLQFKRYDPKMVKPHFIGLDTETYASNGNLIVLCNSDNSEMIRGNANDRPSINDYFDYFRRLADGHALPIFVLWNMKFDASIILKSLPEVEYERFYWGCIKAEIEGAKKAEYESTYDGIHIKYLNKKSLELKKGKNTIYLYDAAQFFGKSLEKAASDDYYAKALKEKFKITSGKEYNGKYKDKKFPDKIEMKEMREIEKYCQLDCVLTARLMEIWVDDFHANFGFYPDRYYSAGYLTANLFKYHLEDFSMFADIPYAVQKLAWTSYFGGRFEIFERGMFENIYHYDINSAYPYAMALLPDLLHGKWIHVTNEADFAKYGQEMGFARIDVEIDEKNVAPFPYRDLEGMILFPSGKIVTSITHHEYFAARKCGYNFKIKKLDGFCFIPQGKGKTPFNLLIEDMYKKRLEMKGKAEGQSTVYKVLVNSGYGKFAQSKPEPKGFFNPVIASFITGKCRAMILEAAANHKDKVIMMATDGIFCKEPIPEIEKVTGKKVLGEWDSEFHPNFRLAMAGVYSFNTKEDLKLETKARGHVLSVKDNKGNMVSFDFDEYKLTYNKEKERYVYVLERERPIALSQAARESKYSVDLIGKFVKYSKEIDINGDTKRDWFRDLKNMKDHVKSFTLEIDL